MQEYIGHNRGPPWLVLIPYMQIPTPAPQIDVMTLVKVTESTPNSFEALLNSKDAAALLGIHEKTLIRLARGKAVPSMRIGKLWRFRASQLDAWLASQVQSTCQSA